MAMRQVGKILGVIGTAFAVLVLLAIGIGVGVGPFSIPILFAVVFVIYGWMLSAFLHYRYGRQQELMHVLTVAAESEVPLGSALWAYLSDRPHGPAREAWVAILLLFVVPGYYWIWHRQHSYDSKIERLANHLESGLSLLDAFEAVPGVASREMLLAAAIGEPSGRLAFCLQALRSPARNQLAMLWLELLPRVAYPVFLVLIIFSVLTFWTIYIGPKFQKIFQDFETRLPEVTSQAMDLGRVAIDYAWIVVPLVLAALIMIPGLIFSATVRWHCPGVGHIYRALTQSRMLQSLGFLLKINTPAPQALSLLAEAGYFASPARRRLRRAQRLIEQGQPLAESLGRARILPSPVLTLAWFSPSSMVPLLKAAERVGNLPWALAELGEHIAQRTLRRVRRLSLLLFPLPIVAVGLLVGFVAIALFLPLVTMMEVLNP